MVKKLRSKWRYILYIILIPCIVVLICYESIPAPRIHSSSLGNNLSSYFYYRASDLQDILVSRVKHSFKITEPKELRKFYSKLDWQRINFAVPYHSAHYSAWSVYDRVGREKLNYLEFWQQLRPVIAATYQDNLPQLQVRNPVVHFRCSDAPFVKLEYYHLVKRDTVEWIAAKIKAKGFDHVTVLSCDQHKRRHKNLACQQYMQYYVGILYEQGISVDYQCESVLHDFASMFYSPLLVSLNPSSFSFMAGVAKDPNEYISCNMGVEHAGKYYLQTQADWLIDSREPLLHVQVDDYNDVDAVIPQLDMMN